jgi:MFS family permease
MHDRGFTPDRGRRPLAAIRLVLAGAVDGGLRNPPVRWLMLAAPFTAGAGIYVFYALQPYLLELAGDSQAYAIAGAAASLSAASQVVGGLLVGRVRRLFHRRTDALLFSGIAGIALLVGIGLAGGLWPALLLVATWGLVGAATTPLRQSFLNGLVPSAQRATVLSFDSLMGSAGGVVAQPALGRVADVNGYAASFLVAAGVHALSVPFTWLARRERSSADPLGAGRDPEATQ